MTVLKLIAGCLAVGGVAYLILTLIPEDDDPNGFYE